MSISTLRGLAKAYSDSIIDRKQYIRQRRALIDDIVAGTAEIIPYESQTESDQLQLDRTFSDGEDTLELPLIDEQTQDSSAIANKGSTKTILLGLVIVGIAISGWFFLKPPPRNDETAEVAMAPPAKPSVRLGDEAQDLLGQFLSDNQWQNERLEALTTQWLAQDPSIRRSAEDSPIVHQMTEVVSQKYLEETALLALADREEILARQRRLLDLATALSPQSERLHRLEAEWQAARLEQPDNLPSETVSTPTPDVQTESDGVELAEEPGEILLPVAVATVTADLAPQHDNKPETYAEPAPQEDHGVAENSSTISGSDHEVEAPAVVPSTAPDDAVAEAIAVTAVVTPTDAAPTPISETRPAKTAPDKQSGTKKSACRAALAKQRRPYCYDTLSEKINGPQLAVLPVGTFNMGGKSSEEQPQRAITVDHPFAVSIYEISQHDFEVYCRAENVTCPPQPWNDANLPVVNVTWEMASAYARWLSETTNATYRLPSESEWEYAARAGTSTPYPFGEEVLPTDARFSFRGSQDTPLASNDRSVNRNNFRLFHMVGNVQEWVADGWVDNYAGAPSDTSARISDSHEKVVRGGSFQDGPENIRSASRAYLAASTANNTTGFRIVREVD